MLMKESKILKTLTLVCFGFLLTSLVAFKSGAFDKYFTSNNEDLDIENAGVSNAESFSIDTPKIKAVDTVRVSPTMLPTSKSIIIIDQKLQFPPQDSLKNILKGN